jgi:peptidyl-prolyl cis-trans isomerase D
MLRGIHKASRNWLGKAVMGIVMGLLVVSFAIWGIGDIFRGSSSRSVAKIGDTEISIDLFRQTFNDRVQQLSRQAGRPVSTERARAEGLDRQLLGQMIAEAALDQRTRQLGLHMSDAEVARRITEDPAFRGPSGQFDRVRFEQLIRNAGYTEPRFVAEQRRTMLRRQVVNTLVGEVKAPAASTEALHRYIKESRTIQYVVLDRDHAGAIAAPTAEDLAKYYEDHKLAFRAPEYRKVAFLPLTTQDVAGTIEVSTDDIRRSYETQKAKFSTPERRQVAQIVFTSADEAAKAAEKLAAGTTFEALATERGLSDKDIDLGLMAKADFVDPSIGDAAFSLQEGATSAVVNGRFGPVILRVAKIEPAKTKSLAEVDGEIRQELATARARDELGKLRDKIEDELASGLRVEEVAKKLGLKTRVIEAVDRSGRDPQGQPIADLPAGVDVIASAFSSDIGIENEALPVPGGGNVWFDVVAITRSRDRALDEVKDRVEARWRDDAVVARLDAKTKELVEKLKSGTPLAEVASAEKLEVKTAAELTRSSTSTAVSAKTVEAAFATAKDAAGSAEGGSATERVIFRVTDITVPPYDPASAEAKQLGESVRTAMGDDLFAQYIGRLQTDLGVSINQTGLNRALGVTPAAN